MIQLQILSGTMAGVTWTARHFPVHVGRAHSNDLCLPDPGVWDEHFTLNFDAHEGLVLTALTEALVTVNQQPVREIRLRNGDSIESGSVRLRFWIANPVQRSLRLHEAFIWLLIAGITFGQLVIIYRLLP